MRKLRALFLLLALWARPALADNFGVSGSVAAGQNNATTLPTGTLSSSRSTTTGSIILGGSSSSCTIDFGVTTASTLNTTCAFTSITSKGAITAGAATGATLTTGDLGASRSTTTGAIVLGGSSTSCTVNFGITTAGVLTAPCSVAVTSTLKGASVIVAGSGTAPSAPAAGDLVGSRSTTTGALELGGTSGAGTFDYGVNHASSFTLSSPLFGSTATFSGAVTSPVLPPVFFGGTSQLIASPHIELFEGKTVAGTSSLTLTFDQAFTNGGLVPTCSVTSHSASAATAANINGVPTTTQVVIYNGNGSSISADVICISE